MPSPTHVLAAAISLGLATLANGQSFVGLTSAGSLYSFNGASPGSGSTTAITGVTAGQTLLAIDFRPADGAIVGLGYNSASGSTSLYNINLSNGLATAFNTFTLGVGLGRVMADFNPTANALRITTSGATGNNLRVPAGGTGALTTDTDLNPANTGIRASAYSRNRVGGGTSGATTLYLIDGTNNSLDLQGSMDFFTGSGTSPNTGTLTNFATLSGISGSSVVGFEVVGGSDTQIGAFFLATGSSFYNFFPGSGNAQATVVGSFTGVTLIDFTQVPEPGTLALCGVAGLAALVAARRRQRTT